MRLQNYGWVYAGVVSLTFSILIFIVSVTIWILAAFALKHFHSPECKIQYENFYNTETHKEFSADLSELLNADPRLKQNCVDGYTPIGQGIFLSCISMLSVVAGVRLSFNPDRCFFWTNLVSNLINLATVGCLALFDFTFYRINLWRNVHSDDIRVLYLYEGISAFILIVLHFISMVLTVISLIQPCDGENCFKPKCDGSPGIASHQSIPSHIRDFSSSIYSANEVQDTSI